MKLKGPVALVVLLLAAALAAQCTVIDSFSDALTSADPSMLGRISRSGVPSDWSGTKAWPGIVNPATTYYYTEYEYAVVGDGNYFQIEIYSSANIFASAYEDSFTPAPGPTSTNYLGDAGSSGWVFFQVFVPTSHILDLVVNNTASSGLNDEYWITVEAFSDTEYTDPTTTPEPASIALTLGGLAAFVLTRRRLASRQ